MNAFVFDVDGTLLNTEKMYMLSLQHTLKENGFDLTYGDVYRSFGLPSYEALQFLEIPNPEKIQKEWQSHYHDFWDEVDVFPGIQDVLAKLAESHSVGLVTSNTAEEYADHANAFGIDQYFDAFVFAGQTPRMKPFADPIEKAMTDLKVEPNETIYIGDSVHDMQAAHNASAKFGLAGWGTKERDLFEHADYIFEVPADIMKLA